MGKQGIFRGLWTMGFGAVGFVLMWGLFHLYEDHVLFHQAIAAVVQQQQFLGQLQTNPETRVVTWAGTIPATSTTTSTLPEKQAP